MSVRKDPRIKATRDRTGSQIGTRRQHVLSISAPYKARASQASGITSNIQHEQDRASMSAESMHKGIENRVCIALAENVSYRASLTNSMELKSQCRTHNFQPSNQETAAKFREEQPKSKPKTPSRTVCLRMLSISYQEVKPVSLPS